MKKTKEIRLSGLLADKHISLELKGNNKKEIIAELVEIIAKSRRLKNQKVFFKAMLEREELGSTGIGNGVAIPHAKSDAVSGLILAFARKDTGIDFGALDGEKTYLFFAFAAPKEEIGAHLKILSEISRLVKDKFIVQQLKKAKDSKEIIKIVSRAGRHPKN